MSADYSLTCGAYTLADGEALHRTHPVTFWMPPLAERMALRPGASVKLMFEGAPAQRMWVTVLDRIDGGRYIGELDSHPLFTDEIQAGDLVEFEPRHVIDIHAGATND